MPKKRILIVEDEKQVATTLRRALEHPMGGGYEVETCLTAEEAFLALGKDHYNLLIADLRLPGMDGLELIRRVREKSPDTRVILITAFGTPEVEEEARQLEARYFTKPFRLHDLVQAAKELLGDVPVAGVDMGSTSEEQFQAIREYLEQLRADTGATMALLSDLYGNVLVQSGYAWDVDINALNALLGNGMAAHLELAHLLGERSAFELHFHEGENFDVYAALVSNETLISLLFTKKGKSNPVGLVWFCLKRVIEALRDLVPQTFAVQQPPSVLDLKGSGNIESILEQAFGSGGTAESEEAEPMTPEQEPEAEPSPESKPRLLSYEEAKELGLIPEGL